MIHPRSLYEQTMLLNRLTFRTEKRAELPARSIVDHEGRTVVSFLVDPDTGRMRVRQPGHQLGYEVHVSTNVDKREYSGTEVLASEVGDHITRLLRQAEDEGEMRVEMIEVSFASWGDEDDDEPEPVSLAKQIEDVVAKVHSENPALDADDVKLIRSLAAKLVDQVIEGEDSK